MKKGLAYSLISLFVVLSVTFAIIHFTNNANKTKQIDMLNADVAIKAKQIETLNADVADKDGQIEMLNADVTEKVGQIETYKADIADKSKQIEALNADVADKAGQIETLNADVTDKAGQIEALNADNKKKDDQIELLKEMVSENINQPASQETDNPLVNAPTNEFVIERLSTVPDIAKIAAATEDNDPNGKLGKQGGYIAQIYFSSPLVNPTYAFNFDLDVVSIGTQCGGSLEVYATVAEAEARNRYLAALDGGMFASGSHTVVGTIIVRTSSKLTSSEQKKLEDEIIFALTATETPSIDKDEKSSALQELVSIKESGFQIVNGYLHYSFIAHNNMTNKALYLPTFRITARDADGALISTTEQTLMVVYPDQDTVYSGRGNQIDELPASVEISYVMTDDDWHIVNTSKLNHPSYTPFEIKSAKLKDNRIVGELYNPNDYSQSTIAISVVFRDKNGQLLTGDTSFINNVKAKETVPFEFRIYSNLLTDSFDIFAQPW